MSSRRRNKDVATKVQSDGKPQKEGEGCGKEEEEGGWTYAKS